MMKLFRGHNAWMVQTDDPEVRELFGTDTIPTPFTLQAEPERVLAEIQARNPGSAVVLQDWTNANGVRVIHGNR